MVRQGPAESGKVYLATKNFKWIISKLKKKKKPKTWKNKQEFKMGDIWDFPGGAVDKNTLANAGDMG